MRRQCYDMLKTCILGVTASRPIRPLQASLVMAVFTEGVAFEFVSLKEAFEVGLTTTSCLIVSNSISNGVLYPLFFTVVVSMMGKFI
jgi:hypothetical protein